MLGLTDETGPLAGKLLAEPIEVIRLRRGVQTARDLVEEDEQIAFRRWLVEVEYGWHGRQTIDRFPAEVATGALDPYAAAPTFGQHTLEVYEELAGMSVEEMAAAIGEELFR